MAHDVHFPGHSKNAESWLAAFDIFALSSDTEQMPLSLLEAMAAGLPALSTDVGDVRSMLSEENGPFVTAIDDKAFAAGLRAMLSKDTGGIGEANRGKAKREYSLDAMIDCHAKILGV